MTNLKQIMTKPNAKERYFSLCSIRALVWPCRSMWTSSMSSGREQDSRVESPDVLSDVMVPTETRQLNVNWSIAASVRGNMMMLQFYRYIFTGYNVLYKHNHGYILQPSFILVNDSYNQLNIGSFISLTICFSKSLIQWKQFI